MTSRIISGRLVIGFAPITRAPKAPVDTRTLAQIHDDREKDHAPDCVSGNCAGCADQAETR